MSTEELLKKIIVSNYGTLTKFADVAGLPYTSLMSVLNRGVQNSGIKNVSKICGALGISTDDLCEGRIVFVPREGRALQLEAFFALLVAQLEDQNVELDGEPLSPEDSAALSIFAGSLLDALRKKKGVQK